MKLLSRVLVLVVVGITAAIVQSASAFVVGEYTELNANDIGSVEEAAAGDLYGFSLDTDGRWLAIGSKFAYTDQKKNAKVQTGAVYVYRRDVPNDGWHFMQKLVPKAQGADFALEFGESVAVARNKILVGARSMLNSNGQSSGAAYLYVYRGKKRGWELETEVEPVNGLDGDEFGRAVALGPNRIIVGARFASNDLGIRAGAVYVYKKRGHRWVQEIKLMDQDGAENDQFGRAISFDESDFQYLAVGSRKASDGEGEQGKVLIYKVDGSKWSLFQVLEADDGVDPDYFGQSVAVAGDLLVVGARDSVDSAGNAVGAVYIYTMDEVQGGWALSQKLMPNNGQDKGQYGFAVDFDPQTASNLAIGARRMKNDAKVQTGLVYLYAKDEDSGEWALDDIVAPEGLNAKAEFGQSVAMDPIEGNWVVVGADQATVNELENAGAAFHLIAHDNNVASQK